VQRLTEFKKIGLLGGTFDPVHNGHLAVANHVLRVLSLDSIWFIPASLPPHKDGHGDGREISSFKHRIAMLERAVSQYSAFVVSDIESKRSTPSYSIDTINILLQQTEQPADLYFIIGADAFFEIDTWKRYKELPRLVSFVIISRPGFPPDTIERVIRNAFPGFKCDPFSKAWNSPHCKGSFILLPMEPVPISSTEIRKKVSRGEKISGLVPTAVEEYIRKQKLYS
jgi:nicotinate-nucleotide adenylyltransferase